MAEKNKNMFSSTRTRVIVLFTVVLLIVAIVVGFLQIRSVDNSVPSGASLNSVPGDINSIPGSLNQTIQYATLQQQQNIEQAQQAEKKGISAIPTIIRAQEFGFGENVGATQGNGGLGFVELSREAKAGSPKNIWFDSLKNEHCSRDSIRLAMEQGAKVMDLKAACTCEDLYKANYPLNLLHDVCSCEDLRKFGVMIQQFKNNGWDAGELRLCGFTACQEKGAGFDALAMKKGGFSDGELKGAGFPETEIQKANGLPDGISAEDVRQAGCNILSLTKEREKGVSAAAIRRISGCSAKALLAAGYTPEDLRQAGFSAADLKKLGLTPAQLKQAGYSARNLLNAGFTPAALAAAGFSPEAIENAEKELPLNMTTDDVQQCGCSLDSLTKEKIAGVSAYDIHKYAGCSVDSLKSVGFSKEELITAGFTPRQIDKAQNILISNMSSVPENMIKAAKCEPGALKRLISLGVSATQIRDNNGCSASALLAAGINPIDLSGAGFMPTQLLAAGESPNALIGMKQCITPVGVIAEGRTANCSPEYLASAYKLHVSAATIVHSLGCNASELKNAGYSAQDLKNAGLTPAELKNAGFSADNLKGAGLTARDLAGTGFPARQLTQAGFTPTSLLDAGFSPSDLKNAGVTAAELKSSGVDASKLKAAGFSPEALREAGFTPEPTTVAVLNSLGQPLAQESQLPTMPSLPGVDNKAERISQMQAANNKQISDSLARQQMQMVEQKYQQKIQQRTSSMLAAANQALHDWKLVSTQKYEQTTVQQNQVTDKTGTEDYSPSAKIDDSKKSSAALVEIGDILFAVIDTAVNSDEPSPILATIVSGPLKGAKLIGNFTLPQNADKMVISFNTLSVPGAHGSIPIHAFAIDPNTARTALSSETNHHYLTRYSALFASTFLEGFGNAFQSADTTITIGGTGGTTDTTVQNGIGRSALENAVIGLATVGKAWGQVAQQGMSRPTTVQVYSGTGIGVLFTQDVQSI